MLELDYNNLYGISSTCKKSIPVRKITESERLEALQIAEDYGLLMERFDTVLEQIDKDYLEYLDECAYEEISTEDDKVFMSEMYSLLSREDILSEKVMEKIKDVKHKVKGKEKAVDKAVAGKVTDVLDSIKSDIRDKHVEKIPFKLSKLVKIGLASGAAIAVMGPVIGGITIITGMMVNKRVSNREKDKLLSEIREEILIVEEKIKDSDSNGDKNEKYQLMRLLNSLRRSELRIKRSML